MKKIIILFSLTLSACGNESAQEITELSSRLDEIQAELDNKSEELRKKDYEIEILRQENTAKARLMITHFGSHGPKIEEIDYPSYERCQIAANVIIDENNQAAANAPKAGDPVPGMPNSFYTGATRWPRPTVRCLPL
jgi:hypothetical protein